MRYGFVGAIWIACCALLLPTGCLGEEFRFSPVNQYGMNLTAEYWSPIIAYVSEKSGVKLTLKIGRTATDTIAHVAADEVEFTFTNHLFSPEREKLGWRVFGRRNLPPVYGEIIVPQDSSIRTLEDLAEDEVAFASPEALIAYKFPYAHLVSLGIEVKPVFAGNFEGTVAQLFAGRVKAAAVNSQVAEAYAKREHRKYRVLWRTEPLNDLALMVSPKVSERIFRAVSGAFFSMHADPRGREILRQASEAVGLSPSAYFIPATGAEYAAYRHFYASAPSQLR